MSQQPGVNAAGSYLHSATNTAPGSTVVSDCWCLAAAESCEAAASMTWKGLAEITAVQSLIDLLQLAPPGGSSCVADTLVDVDIAEFLTEAAATQSDHLLGLVQSLSDDTSFNMSCGDGIKQRQRKEMTLKLIEEHISSVCSTYILEREVFVNDLSVCYGVLTSLVALYNEPAVDKNNVTQRLVTNGNHTSLKKVCGLVLSELLVDLSCSALDIAKYWPGGCNAFKRDLSAGILSLPPGTRHWYQILKMQEVPQHVKNCILIYFYFLILLIRAEDVNMDLSALVAYLLLFPDGLILPLPVLKVLFLVFSVATLSSKNNVHPDLFNKANKVLLNTIEKCDRFPVIYSHHPALLYWAFLSNEVPYRFQCDILQLWLEHEEDDAGGILTHLLLTKYEASFCLLYFFLIKDVIQQSKNPVLSRGMLVFNKAMLHEQQNNKDILIGLLWNMLPRVLAKYSTGITPLCDVNVATFMQLACVSSPGHLNATDVARAALFVSIILSSQKSSSLEFDVAAVRLALHLLLASVESRDIRVPIAYIKQRNFLRRLHEACESPDTEICSSSVNLLAKLLFLQEKLRLANSITVSFVLTLLDLSGGFITRTELALNGRQCMQYINLEGKKLLKLLSHTDVNILKASVELVVMLVKTKATVPIVKIALDGGYAKSNRFILVLFGKIQDVCCKRLPGIQESCWQCLGTILAYAAHRHVDPALLPLLATQPWTHVLVRVELGCGSSRISPGFLYFVCCWLLYYQRSKVEPTHNCFQSKRMFPDLLSVSATRIATALLNQTVQCNNNDRQHKLYLTALLRLVKSCDGAQRGCS
ncbi:meiosis inhibitor protein 1-like [Schistocerca cancellata]|uniref:meiosis inhibitor protein 1-like n=1 Tax=Schistocerca cancellata TaxID=274614 RepID=UPI0021196B60|nr:meiosis inhibitor protein 1-like [Schistocerca cancellata]